MGYLQKGYDFDKTLLSSEKALDYFSFVGAMPILDHLLDKNPIFRMGPPGFNTITATAIQRVQDRVQGKDGHIYDPKTPDYLDRFLEIKKVNPNDVDDFQIISWLMVNLIAGADTTAITIRSAIYYPLKDPRVWKKLVKEVRESTITSTIPPEYKDAKALPYVEAVVREALRFLPGVALPIQRYVPKAGFTLPNGDYLPPGTIVGMNPYVSNRNKEVFGHDSHDFRPERWLRDDANETEDEYQLRLSRMNKCDISFGGGSRICLGQHIGLFQTYKVLVTLVAKYDIELATDKEWKVINSWFPRQEGLEVKISPAPGS